MTRNVTTWSTRTRTPVSSSEIGATSVRITGRMMALNSVIRMTAIAASTKRPIVTPGRIPAVRISDTTATMNVMMRRFRSATGPPRHSHRIWIWVV